MADETPKLEIMDFYADWCGPCHVMKPILEEIATTYQDTVTLTKIDVDEEQALASDYQILSIPTMIFKKGGRIVDQVIGAIPKDQLAKKIDELLAIK